MLEPSYQDEDEQHNDKARVTGSKSVSMRVDVLQGLQRVAL